MCAAPSIVCAAPATSTAPLQQLFLDEPDALAIELLPFDSAPLSLHLFDITSDDKTSLQRPPELTAYLEEPVTRPVFQSRRVLKEPREPLSQDAVISFTLEAGGNFQSWKAQIVDGHGRVIKAMSGAGNPVEIRWDGTEDGWMRVRAGEPYNVILSGIANDGATVRQTGKPVIFEAVMHPAADRTTLALAASPLFTAGNAPVLTDKGEDRLLAVAAVLAAHMSDPVTIDIFSKDSARAAKQKELVVANLSNVLLRAPEELVGDIQVDPNEEEEVRVTIMAAAR
jgi:hypothetical protein